MSGSRATIGAAWLLGARMVARFIDLATLVVLARLLTPADFGVVAVAVTLVCIVETLLELPVGSVLVHVHEPTRGHYDTAFTLSLLRGVVLGVLLCAIAWPYALAYGDPRLTAIVVALGLAPITRSCLSPRLASYTRDLRYERESALIVLGKATAFVSAVSVAASNGHYWALVAGTVAGPSAMLVASYAMAPHRPRLTLAELPAFKSFLGWLSGAQIISALSWQCDRLLLGQIVDRPQLGQFAVASDLASLPIQAVAVPVAAPMFPAMARLRSEPDRLRAAFLVFMGATAALCWPVMVGLASLAEPLVRLVLGPQWLNTIVLVQLLTMSLACAVIAYPVSALARALGRTDIVFRAGAVELICKLPLLVVGGTLHGLLGVACVRLLAEAGMMAFYLVQARRLVGLAIRTQLAPCARPFGASVAMGALLAWIRPALAHLHDPLPLALGLACTALVGGLAYLAALIGLWILAGRPRSFEADGIDFATRLVRRTRPAPA